ncbi:MAG: Glutamine-dependent NAD(+) synthetase [Candidatus Accumulibacter sp. BA-94]|nr:MAG: Glutamine-dependent NAD(+) synthetase [Candidatus Accumulibacter sp. BA-94]
MSARIAIAQINATVGDFSGNRARIVEFARRARQQNADLLLTPELALCGYPPEDLLLRDDFCSACESELQVLAGELPDIAVLVGHPEQRDGRRYNAATLLSGGHRVATYHKQRLPSYEVFDEERYFDSGAAACILTLNGLRCGVNICADVWEAGAADLAREAGADVLLVLNASPYHIGKRERRTEVLRQRISSTGLPVVYANLAGGQDELVFDGGSFVLDSRGILRCQLPQFEEALGIVDFVDGEPQPTTIVAPPCQEAEIYQALVLGVRDYLGKNGFPGAIIGLSGGIDSALTLCVAVDALGADKVRAVMMPSPYTAELSLSEAREMVRLLGVRYDEIAIAPAMETLAGMLAGQFAGLPADTTEENLQARIRGMILMALSNKTGSLVLTTGNKSEMAVGYCTLYGDMAGGHGWRLRGHQGYRQNPRLPHLALAQHLFARHPRTHHQPPAVGRAEARPDRPGQPAALRGARRDRRSLHGEGPQPAPDHCPGICRRRRAARRPSAEDQRVQASPGAGRNPGHAARFWQGLAVSDHQPLP